MPAFFTALKDYVAGPLTLVTQKKSARPGALLSWHGPGQAVWAPRDYQAFAREGFMENPIVYRSVRMISEAAATIPLVLHQDGVEVEDHPLLDVLANPCPNQTATDLLESWYGYLLVAGNGYLEAVAVGGELRELHALRPDRMKVIPGADGWPDGFEYQVDGRRTIFRAEPVANVRPILHLRLFHPANDHYGMSPIEAAAKDKRRPRTTVPTPTWRPSRLSTRPRSCVGDGGRLF